MLGLRRFAAAAACIASLAACAPFFILFIYSHPQNDDWVSAASSINRGVLGSAEWWMRNWSGRYSATLLNAATPLTFRSLNGWRAANAAYSLAVPLGIWAIVTVLAPRSSARGGRLAIAASVSAVLFASMPSPAGGIYWMNGSICYGVGEGLALLAVAAMLAGERDGATHSWAWTGVAALLAAVAVGTNEVIALLLIGVVGIVLLSKRWTHRPWTGTATVFAVSVAGLGVILLIPGTGVRLASGGPSGGRYLLPILTQAIVAAGIHAARWSTLTIPLTAHRGLARHRRCWGSKA